MQNFKNQFILEYENELIEMTKKVIDMYASIIIKIIMTIISSTILLYYFQLYY